MVFEKEFAPLNLVRERLQGNYEKLCQSKISVGNFNFLFPISILPQEPDCHNDRQ